MDSANVGIPTEGEVTNEGDSKRCSLQKVLIGAFLLGFIVYVIIDSNTSKNVQKVSSAFLAWVTENPVPGVFAFIGVYFIATVLFLPGSILTLGSGFVFSSAFGLGRGVFLGIVAVFVGASLGAIAAFLLGRYLLQEQVGKLAQKYPVFEAIDSALAEKGLLIFVLLRLSPIIPFNALNYLAGATRVSFRAYTTALIAILPGTSLYVFLGSSAGSLANVGDGTNETDNTTTIITIVAGIVFGVLAVGVSSYYAKQELNKILGEKEENENENENANENEGIAP
eukprot:CAMPEP_0194321710 /NCGR_PEP_ID=MMETSP0171-20130528/17909_1 /TAXON_ID=218684 /ORGANISM="Corethron pennatum, Strain L29A3" /LENGTH=281 /DNA_ID=CAMNT_0039079713 /DNA_START=59 /DNA_END=904 /DNA_ORIENTATION=+